MFDVVDVRGGVVVVIDVVAGGEVSETGGTTADVGAKEPAIGGLKTRFREAIGEKESVIVASS